MGKKKSKEPSVARYSGVRVLFRLHKSTQVKVKVQSFKTTLRSTIYPKSYSSKCKAVNVTRYYPPQVLTIYFERLRDWLINTRLASSMETTWGTPCRLFH